MGYYKFSKETTISSEAILKKTFAEDDLKIRGENSSITFNGLVILMGKIIFEGNSKLEDGVYIDEGCIISDSQIGKRTKIRPYSLLYKSTFGEDNIIGPFCFVRDKCNINNSCIIGNAVELTRSTIRDYVKISHQCYIGDAYIDSNVIVGAGTVFCNYDGEQHQKAIIGSKTLIGSGSMIISPIHIGKSVTIAAGSVVNKDIVDNKKFIQKR